MKLNLNTGIVGKGRAEDAYLKVAIPLSYSNLPFVIRLEHSRGTFDVTVELNLDVFDTWEEMECYIRRFIKRVNANENGEFDCVQDNKIVAELTC